MFMHNIVIKLQGRIGNGDLHLGRRETRCLYQGSLSPGNFLQEHRQGRGAACPAALLRLTAGFLLWRLIEYVKFFLPLFLLDGSFGKASLRGRTEALPGWRSRAEPRGDWEEAANGIGLAESLQVLIQAEMRICLGIRPARGVQAAGVPLGDTSCGRRQAATLRAELARGPGPDPPHSAPFFPVRRRQDAAMGTDSGQIVSQER